MNHYFDPVGRCIYCGSTSNLSDEHIVPYGLWGQHILPKACCNICSGVTSAFEGQVLRANYGLLRIRGDAPTRRPKDRPTHLPMVVEKNGIKRTMILPVGAAPATIVFVHFKPPGYLRKPRGKKDPLRLKDITFRWLPPDPKVKIPGLNPWSPNGPLSILALARLLAKIAHAYAVAKLGIDNFEHWLPPIILGEDDNFGNLVGGLPPNMVSGLDKNSSQYQLKCSFHKRRKEWLVLVHIWYFADGGNPENCVVVGKTSEEFVKSVCIGE